MRHFDKTVVLIALVLFVALVGFQCYVVFSERALAQEKLASAKKLSENIFANDRPDMTRDPALYSLKVFEAWEQLPFAQTLTAWDFYPNQPLP